MNKPTILVVEDDVPVRCLITTTLKTHGYKYLTASNGETAIMMTTSHNPDIMLDRKSTRLNSSHKVQSRMPSSA